MTQRRARTATLAGWAGGLLLGACLPATVSFADVTPSGLGTAVNGSLVPGAPPADGAYNITGGYRPGGNGPNLFHSLGNFSLTAAESANFLSMVGEPATSNILARVTGGNPSSIFGRIDSSSYGSANLFLMNPAGIMFGPTAQLNVAASFHATTADYISLSDGNRFNAVPSGADALLSTMPPSAFGFLTANPAPIDVQAGTFDFITTGYFSNVFEVPAGNTLSFVGGNLSVGSQNLLPPAAPPAPGGFLLAPGGTINLVSVASPGEVPFNGGIDTSGIAQLGNISVHGGAIVDAKNIVIRGGQLAVQDATIYPGLFWLAGWQPIAPDGGGVDIQVTNAVNITSVVGPILTFPGIETQAGSADDLVLGAVPSISIAADSVAISNGARILATRLGPGDPPSISIDASSSVDIRDGSAVTIVNQFEGPGGTITVQAQDVTLDSGGVPGTTGIQAQSTFHPAYGQADFLYFPFFQLADSGSIVVDAAGQLTIRNNAQISADSFAFGRSGSVTVNAGDMLLVGAGTNTAAITSQSGLAGDSGSVTVHADRTIDMQNGFRISANTFGSGSGGSVNVSAGQSLTMSGQSTLISSQTDQPLDGDLAPFSQLFSAAAGVFIPDYPTLRSLLGIAPSTGDLMQVLQTLALFGLVAVDDFTSGDAGQVTVSAPLVSVNANAAIETSTLWGGTVMPGGVVIPGGGDAGAIVLNVDSLNLTSGGSIRSRSGGVRLDRGLTAGTGTAGTIDVNATDTISISGRSPTSGEGSFVSTSTFGDGNGGNISLDAGKQVQIADGGLVSADSLAQVGSGTGLSGNIAVTSGDSITLDDGTISTRAVTSDGGNISLFAPNIVYLNNSQITTSVESGFGGGGNILIDPQFVILNNSSIIANAFGGPGGNITIIADNYLSSATSLVQASSALSTPGVIRIVSPENNIESTIAQLASEFLDASSLLRGLCSARRTGAASSFTVANRGGVPVEADGYLPSFSMGAANGSASIGAPVQANSAGFGEERIALALVMPDTLDCAR